MLEKNSLRSPCRTFGLALLLTVAAGCKAAPDQEGAAPGSPKADSTPGATPPGPAAAGGAAGQQPLPSHAPTLAMQDLPEVVAKVNGQEIHKGDLLQGAQMIEVQLAQRGQRVPATSTFYRRVLDELIAIALLQQEAKAQGMTASDLEVQQQVDARKRTFPNEEAYKQALASSGITEATLRQQAHDQLAVRKYLRSQFGGELAVSDQAVREFYAKNQDKMRQPERLHLRHIFLRVTEKASPADQQAARQKADAVLKRLRAGEDFATLALESSEDPGSKSRGGDLGWLAKGQTAPTFEAAAFALRKPNDVSAVVESPFGFHIVQLVERQPAGTVPYEQVKGRIADQLKQQQSQQKVLERVQALRARGKVEIYDPLKTAGT